MIRLFCFALTVLASPFKSKLRLEAENAVLRHQLMVLTRRLHGRVRLTNNARWFFTGDDFPTSVLHACATLHRGEVWELINTTDELHYFHLHQGKFRLARKGDPVMPNSVTETFQDPAHLLDGIVAERPTTTPNVDLWHDTFPVPPKNGNINVAAGICTLAATRPSKYNPSSGRPGSTNFTASPIRWKPSASKAFAVSSGAFQ
jgi:FtsP/CotA-like multicopper oxidase with cupredoxin domain